MVRVRVSEKDGVNFLRAHAEQRQIGNKRAADAVGPAGAGIHQHRVPASADQVSADLDGLRRG